MFGRPRFADASFVLGEFSNGMAATAKALEPEHPNATPTDTQAISVWIFVIILHAVLQWGRTDEKTVATLFHEFGSMMQQNSDVGAWDLDTFLSEIERCQRLLRTHVATLNYDGLKEAASAYYRGLAKKEPSPSLREEDFLKFAVSTFLANAMRLRDSGHIKLK